MNRGELVGRADPYYYKKIFFDLRKFLRSLPNIKKVGSLIKSCSRGDGPRDGFYTEDKENGVYFLRVNNLKDHSIDLTDVKLINRSVHENTLKRTQVNPGDVVFAVSGTKDNLGTVSIIPEYVYEANLNSALLRIRLKEGIVSKEYFTFFFDLHIADLQIDMIGKGTAQNNLNSEEIFSMLMPVLSTHSQKVVVDKIWEAKKSRQHKEAQAQALLDSIDGYLLGELGITLPPELDNTIENRMFKMSWRQVSGGRFDPISLSKERVNALIAIQNGKYAPQRLHNIANFPKIVFTDNPSLLPYVGLENIESNTGFYQETNEKESFGSALNFKKGQVLFPKLRPYLNKVYYADFEGLCSTEFVILEAKGTVYNAFLAEFLRSRAVVAQTKHLSSGNTLPRLQTEDTRRLLVTVPPVDLQEKIVQKINDIRQQAQDLRQKAQREFAEAKQEIEQLILG